MPDLKDYSGEFRPDLSVQDFDKDALVRLAVVAGKDAIAGGGGWHSIIERRYGREVAEDCSKEFWEGAQILDLRWTAEAFNIKGNDVATVFKYLQVTPLFMGPLYVVEYELKNKNLGVMTVKGCPSLDYWERHGNNELIKFGCEVIDVALFQLVANYFNPDMKFTPVKLPPRKSKEEIPCQWELRLE